MANFKYVEKITSSQDLLNVLKEELTNFTEYPYSSTAGETATGNDWALVSEDRDPTGTKVKELVLAGKSTVGTQSKEFHVRFINPSFGDSTKHSSLVVQVLEGFDEATNTYRSEGHPVNFEWADQEAEDTDRDSSKPVYLYLNVMNNRLAMVLVGDPAVNFIDYRKSFLYVGATKPFKYNADDCEQNILLTAGAVTEEPEEPITGYNYGIYTSYGNNTMQMFQTKSGIKFQRHYPSFITQAPDPSKAYSAPGIGNTGLQLEPQGFNASAWTRKYHLSPIYVVHPYDGYRGQLEYCIAVSKNNILHLDELIVDVENKKWKQEVYRYFDHNTEQNFMNYSANVKMGIAFLKEVRY